MRSDDISQDMGHRNPSGSRDIGLRLGVVLAWDDLTGANTIAVDDETHDDLRVVQGGIGISYGINDVVLIGRKQSTYFILGKVAAPGAGAAQQIVSASIQTNEGTSSTSYVDLATPGPSVQVQIGSSRRALVTFSAGISSTANPANQFVGGSASFSVTGSSSIAMGAFSASALHLSPDTTQLTGVAQTTTRSLLLTAADGLNAGLNIFTMQYHTATAGITCNFNSRNITVIPF